MNAVGEVPGRVASTARAGRAGAVERHAESGPDLRCSPDADDGTPRRCRSRLVADTRPYLEMPASRPAGASVRAASRTSDRRRRGGRGRPGHALHPAGLGAKWSPERGAGARRRSVSRRVSSTRTPHPRVPRQRVDLPPRARSTTSALELGPARAFARRARGTFPRGSCAGDVRSRAEEREERGGADLGEARGTEPPPSRKSRPVELPA